MFGFGGSKKKEDKKEEKKDVNNNPEMNISDTSNFNRGIENPPDRVINTNII